MKHLLLVPIVLLTAMLGSAFAQEWQAPDPRRNLSVAPMFDTNLPPVCSDLPWLYNALDTAEAKKLDTNPRNKEALYWLGWRTSQIKAKIDQTVLSCDPAKIVCYDSACASFNRRFPRRNENIGSTDTAGTACRSQYCPDMTGAGVQPLNWRWSQGAR